MNKKKIAIIVGSILVLIVALNIVFYKMGTGAVSSKNHEVIVEIEEQSSGYKILETLDQNGLVKNKFYGKMFLKLHSFNNLQANVYVLNQNMSLNEIFTIINEQSSEYIVKKELTIIPGQTIPEVAKNISNILEIDDKTVLSELSNKDFLESLIKDYWFLDSEVLKEGIMFPLEGYLYPETYYITSKEPTLDSIIRMVLDYSDKQFKEVKDGVEKTEWTMHEFLSFASIVEQETLFDEDKPKIAGVFMNRYNKNMPFQSDVTVNYALQKTGVEVSIKQTQVDSPYNTYKNAGLPIGPISSVTLDTLKDCLDYEKNDYEYFFAKKDGKVIYSKTYEEHKKAVQENRWY